MGDIDEAPAQVSERPSSDRPRPHPSVLEPPSRALDNARVGQVQAPFDETMVNTNDPTPTPVVNVRVERSQVVERPRRLDGTWTAEAETTLATHAPPQPVLSEQVIAQMRELSNQVQRVHEVVNPETGETMRLPAATIGPGEIANRIQLVNDMMAASADAVTRRNNIVETIGRTIRRMRESRNQLAQVSHNQPTSHRRDEATNAVRVCDQLLSAFDEVRPTINNVSDVSDRLLMDFQAACEGQTENMDRMRDQFDAITAAGAAFNFDPQAQARRRSGASPTPTNEDQVVINTNLLRQLRETVSAARTIRSSNVITPEQWNQYENTLNEAATILSANNVNSPITAMDALTSYAEAIRRVDHTLAALNSQIMHTRYGAPQSQSQSQETPPIPTPMPPVAPMSEPPGVVHYLDRITPGEPQLRISGSPRTVRSNLSLGEAARQFAASQETQRGIDLLTEQLNSYNAGLRTSAAERTQSCQELSSRIRGYYTEIDTMSSRLVALIAEHGTNQRLNPDVLSAMARAEDARRMQAMVEQAVASQSDVVLETILDTCSIAVSRLGTAIGMLTQVEVTEDPTAPVTVESVRADIRRLRDLINSNNVLLPPAVLREVLGANQRAQTIYNANPANIGELISAREGLQRAQSMIQHVMTPATPSPTAAPVPQAQPEPPATLRSAPNLVAQQATADAANQDFVVTAGYSNSNSLTMEIPVPTTTTVHTSAGVTGTSGTPGIRGVRGSNRAATDYDEEATDYGEEADAPDTNPYQPATTLRQGDVFIIVDTAQGSPNLETKQLCECVSTSSFGIHYNEIGQMGVPTRSLSPTRMISKLQVTNHWMVTPTSQRDLLHRMWHIYATATEYPLSVSIMQREPSDASSPIRSEAVRPSIAERMVYTSKRDLSLALNALRVFDRTECFTRSNR